MMKVFRAIFRFYIHGSIHVAFAVLSLLFITQHTFKLPLNNALAAFVFFGTVAGYNFVKYHAYFRKSKSYTIELKTIAAFSILSALLSCLGFIQLNLYTQSAGLIFFSLTLLYTVPFIPGITNMRNWSGIKIYMVAVCWSGITILLPLLQNNIAITIAIIPELIQRFLLVIALILIFEIKDSKDDDPHLNTVPQKIGIRNTKILNIILIAVFYGLSYISPESDIYFHRVDVLLSSTLIIFTLFATPNRSLYYTLFWVESLPIFWYGLILLFSIDKI